MYHSGANIKDTEYWFQQKCCFKRFQNGNIWWEFGGNVTELFCPGPNPNAPKPTGALAVCKPRVWFIGHYHLECLEQDEFIFACEGEAGEEQAQPSMMSPIGL